MSRVLFFLLAAITAFAADDPWAKVRELKSGTELRVYKKGTPQPVLAKSDDVTDDNLLVVVKNEQVAIPKDQIDRIDYRPTKPGGRLTTETKTKTTEPDTTPKPPGFGSTVPGSSTSTSVGIGSKPDFELIYKRPTTPAAKK
jgi:hypothetical protein